MVLTCVRVLPKKSQKFCVFPINFRALSRNRHSKGSVDARVTDDLNIPSLDIRSSVRSTVLTIEGEMSWDWDQ